MNKSGLLIACALLMASCSSEPAVPRPSDDSLIQAYADRMSRAEGVQQSQRRGNTIVVKRDDVEHTINVKGVKITGVPDNAMRPYTGELTLEYVVDEKNRFAPAFFEHHCASRGGTSKWDPLRKSWTEFECENGNL